MTDPDDVLDPAREAAFLDSPGHLLDPVSGEIYALPEAPLEVIGRWLEHVRYLKQAADTGVRQVSEEVNRRMDHVGRWTLREGEYEVTGASPARRPVYDGERLWRELDALARRGVIDPAAVAGAVEIRVTHTPRADGIARLLKLGGEVADAVRRCETGERPRGNVSARSRRP
jgi:hypothetical protein